VKKGVKNVKGPRRKDVKKGIKNVKGTAVPFVSSQAI